MKTGTKKIKTSRLVLRKFKFTDYFAMVKWFTNTEMAKFMASRTAPSKAQVLRKLGGTIKKYYKKDYYCWMITLDNKSIGFIELQPLKTPNAYNVSEKVDMSLNGNGYATEALAGVLDYMKTQDIKGILGVCNVDNFASKRVMEKVGMTEIGDPETNKPFIFKDGTSSKTHHFIYKY